MKDKEMIDLVAEVGSIMLSSNAEIGRVKETMANIASGLGIEDYSAYLLSNGIFLSGSVNGNIREVRITEVPVKGTSLYEVEELNNLSRRISKEHMTAEEVRAEVDRIKTTSPHTFFATALASGIGCAAFCYMFGGTIQDCIADIPIGMLLWVCMDFLDAQCKQPKIIINLFSSIFISILAIFFTLMGMGTNVDKIIIGAIMPLVPGVPFVTAIRHFFNDDFLSGTIRLADALLTALCVGVGVGVVISAWNNFAGVVLM